MSTWFDFAKKNQNPTIGRNWGQESRPRSKGDSEKSKGAQCNEFELEPQDIKPGVEIQGLTKEFSLGHSGKKKRVVDDFHLNLLQGQITVRFTF